MPIDLYELERMAQGNTPSLPPICLKCGYNLAHAASIACPECGTSYQSRDWRTDYQNLKMRMMDVRDGTRATRVGLTVVLVGWVASVLLVITVPWLWRFALRYLAIGAGLVAAVTFLLNLIPVFTLPSWVREEVTFRNSWTKPSIVIILGLALIAFAILY